MVEENKDDNSSVQDYSPFVLREGEENAIYLMVQGIKCASCAFLIENVLNAEAEVSARVNLTTKRLALRWKGDPSRANELIGIAAAKGYKFMPFDQKQLDNDDRREERFLMRCMAVAGFASGNIMLLSVGLWSSSTETMGFATRSMMHWTAALISIPTMLYAGRPFFASAWNALRHGRANMDVPISVALILTTAMSLFETINHGEHSYFDSVVMLLFLLLIGRYLDRKTRGRARAAAQDLLAMMAGSATVVESGGNRRILPIRELKSGMILQIAAGERVAADGVVEGGRSEIDPSFITGETVTQPVEEGSRVFGGMVNVLSPITVSITAAGEESLLAEVIKLMEKAEQGHALYVRLADRVARWYTPVVHILAFGTFAVWLALGTAWQPALLTAMTVLIITCPCALGLAVPAVQVLASGRLFKRGMLLKSADAIERLADVDVIAFDKTGTLTMGKPKLVEIVETGTATSSATITANNRLRLAAALAAHSRHPLAKALMSEVGKDCVAPQAFEVSETSGQGMEGVVEGRRTRLGRRDWCGDMAAPNDDRPELWLKIEEEPPTRFAFADELRSDAKEVVEKLRSMGCEVVLLSGDRAKVVESAARALGISDFRSGLKPAEKCAAIEAMRSSGKRVLMVGDGLNDAPALSAADVSMSPSSALDITQNAADIVFQGDALAPVIEAMSTSKRAESLVRQNFIMSFAYNALAVPLAMLGHVTPLIAAVAMASSSIIVVVNAQRLNLR